MDIYVVEVDFNKISEEHYKVLYCGVSEETRYKVNSKRLFEDKVRTLVGEYYVINNLKNVGYEIKRSKYGKPYINGKNNFNYSISHSNNRVVIGISNKPIGVDVECIRGVNYKNIISFFHEDEKATFLKDKDDRLNLMNFFQMWTIKEAYIKMKGMGLYIDLSSFKVEKNSKNKWFIANEEDDINIGTVSIGNYIISWATSEEGNESLRKFHFEEIII